MVSILDEGFSMKIISFESLAENSRKIYELKPY